MKNFRNTIAGFATAAILGMVISALAFGPGVTAQVQTVGSRDAGNGVIKSGQGANGGFYGFEPSYGVGADVALERIGAGQVGVVQAPSAPNAVIAPPPVIALSTATTGGTIPDATYRLVLMYATPNGGLTNVAAAGEATQATSGGGLSTITATAPIAAAGAAGYVLGVSPAAGATLTETIYPLTTANCAGAFQVNAQTVNTTTQGVTTTTGLTVCPFGVNAVITSLSPGVKIPLQNTAAFPAAIPQEICTKISTTAIVTITTIQAFDPGCILAAGLQNVSGKHLLVTGNIIYTSSAQTGTATVSLTEGGITPVAITSAAITTGGQTNAQLKFSFDVTTALTGTAGTLEPHGILYFQGASAANGTAMTIFGDTNTAVSSAINLTASNTLKINLTMTSSTTSAQLRDLHVYLMN